MSRRPYIRKVKRSWWLGQRRYVIYMVRELTSLFVGFYCVLLVVGLSAWPRAARRGTASWPHCRVRRACCCNWLVWRLPPITA